MKCGISGGFEAYVYCIPVISENNSSSYVNLQTSHNWLNTTTERLNQRSEQCGVYAMRKENILEKLWWTKDSDIETSTYPEQAEKKRKTETPISRKNNDGHEIGRGGGVDEVRNLIEGEDGFGFRYMDY